MNRIKDICLSVFKCTEMIPHLKSGKKLHCNQRKSKIESMLEIHTVSNTYKGVAKGYVLAQYLLRGHANSTLQRGGGEGFYVCVQHFINVTSLM